MPLGNGSVSHTCRVSWVVEVKRGSSGRRAVLWSQPATAAEAAAAILETPDGLSVRHTISIISSASANHYWFLGLLTIICNRGALQITIVLMVMIDDDVTHRLAVYLHNDVSLCT